MKKPFITVGPPPRPADPVEAATYDEKLRTVTMLALVEYAGEEWPSGRTLIEFLLGNVHRAPGVVALTELLQTIDVAPIDVAPNDAPPAVQERLAKAIDVAIESINNLLEAHGEAKPAVLQ